jgi:pyruvate, water dikinase
MGRDDWRARAGGWDCRRIAMRNGNRGYLLQSLLWFHDEACQDVSLAGGKGASLARMLAQGFPVPPGFVLPAHLLEESVDSERLRELALALDHQAAQALIQQAEPPRALILAGYEQISGSISSSHIPCEAGAECSCASQSISVAVRSSARAEDSDVASYAGQQETYLNVIGGDAVCARVLDCWASFFSERALFYRSRKGSLNDLGMAVVVQKMLNPRKSGVCFTADPVNHRRDRMIIEAVFGLGEPIVSGQVTPDHYVIDRLGNVKREQIVHQRVLEQREIRQLAEMGVELTRRFGSPQDIEWAIEGDQLYLLQSRPVTTL